MTKRLLPILCFVLFALSSNAQNKKWSVEASYPVSVGDEFQLDGRGKVDLGVRFRFVRFGNFELGGSVNGSLFYDTSIGNGNDEIKLSQFFLQPRLFLETAIPGLEILRPSLGLGYTREFYSTKGLIIGGEPRDSSFSEGAFNLNIGLSADIFKNWFLQVQYDYIRKDQDLFNPNLGLLKMGIGVRF